VPYHFSLREVEMYGSVTAIELQGIETSTIERPRLRELLVDALKVSFLLLSSASSTSR
jgi:hypothetical protein